MVNAAKQKRMEQFLLILLIITIGFIWVNSMLSGETSSDESRFVMALVSPFLEIFVGKGNVTMHMVRKLAHFTEYFILGCELTVFTSICERTRATSKKWLQIVIPLAAGLLIAAIDETIQIFSFERGPSVKDVLLDFVGVFTAFVITRLIIMLIRSSKHEHTDS